MDPSGIQPFTESLARLEAQIADADASGDAIPPEARQMATKLRELIDALSALSSVQPPGAADGELPAIHHDI